MKLTIGHDNNYETNGVHKLMSLVNRGELLGFNGAMWRCDNWLTSLRFYTFGGQAWSFQRKYSDIVSIVTRVWNMKDWVGTQNIIDQAFPIWPMIISFDQPDIGRRIEKPSCNPQHFYSLIIFLHMRYGTFIPSCGGLLFTVSLKLSLVL